MIWSQSSKNSGHGACNSAQFMYQYILSYRARAKQASVCGKERNTDCLWNCCYCDLIITWIKRSIQAHNDEDKWYRLVSCRWVWKLNSGNQFDLFSLYRRSRFTLSNSAHALQREFGLSVSWKCARRLHCYKTNNDVVPCTHAKFKSSIVKSACLLSRWSFWHFYISSLAKLGQHIVKRLIIVRRNILSQGLSWRPKKRAANLLPVLMSVDATNIELQSLCKHWSKSIICIAGPAAGRGTFPVSAKGAGRSVTNAVINNGSILVVIGKPEYGTQTLNSDTRQRNSKRASCNENR